MGLPEPVARFSHEDFLAWEATQTTAKHEFVRGEVFAMVGARRSHVAVTANIVSELRARFMGGPCVALMTDMMVRVDAADCNFYPDVVVTCHDADRTADRVLQHPVLVVEVLSDSTEAYDRGAKFEAYRKLPSLREYVLVDPDGKKIESFRLNEAGLWELHEFAAGSDVTFASVGATVPWDAVFVNA